DNCGLKRTGVRPGTPTNDGCEWTVTHEYYAIDNCNNEATCTQTFTWIVDGGAPTLIDCPDGGDLGCNPDPSEYAPTAAVWDDECGTIAEEGVRAGTPSNDGCEWTVTHEYNAIDNCNNEATCTQTFTWTIDTEDPQLVSCPAGSNLGCNPDASEYAPTTAQWTDNCGLKETGVREGTPTSNGCNWTVTHEYYAIDNCDNESTCTKTFTWTIDTQDPVLQNCPAGGDLGFNPAPAAYAPGTAQWSDNCGLKQTGVRPGTPTNDGCNWTVTHEYYAIDNCNNEATCTQTFTWQVDGSQPTLVSCPAGGNLGCNPDPSEYAPTDADWDDECGTIAEEGVREGTPTNNGCTWMVTHQYYAKDEAGNESTCTQTFTWTVDTQNPTVVACPAGGDLGFNPAPTAYAPGTAQWSDNCGLKRTGVRPGTPTNDGCEWTVTHEYYAIDNCNNEATCTQTFTWIVDGGAPTLIDCPDGGDLGCNPDPSEYAPTAAVWDDACGTIAEEGVRAGTPSNDGCEWTVTHEYYAIDEVGNENTCTQTFTWTQDTEDPQLVSCPVGGELGCNPSAAAYAPATATWTDNCGIKNKGVRAGTPTRIGCNWTVTHEYYAIDNCGNEATCTQTFTWTADTEDPQIVSCPAGGNLGCNPDASAYAPGAAQWTDNCGLQEMGVREGIPTNNGCNWTVTHEYYAIDNCDNERTCTQTFTWKVDTEAPTCVYTGTIPTLTCGVDVMPDLRGSLSKSDNCSAANKITVVQNPAPGTPIAGSLTVTFSVTDECNNTGTCELSISCIPPSGGCTYTPGYWKNHAEDICVENIPCVGNPLKAVAGNGNNPWVILARAYAAAYLNKVCAEASVESIQAEFDKAANLLCTYDQAYAARLRGSARAEWTALANKIDLFNNGLVGPPHCTTPLSNLNSKEEGPKLNIHTELDVIAFPNPFTQSTTIRFVVAYDSQVTIDVFNTAGQQITTLFKGKVAANVTQDVLFSPDKADGEIYFYPITTERGTTFGKLVSTQ
ncbi:MAG: T9SS type A sorting domain-containing protein, partial [Saprospiraceae bacterium]